MTLLKILLVHQNFPGQFKHLLPALQGAAHEVTVFTMNTYAAQAGERVVRYSAAKGTGKDVHPWVAETETKVIRGEAAFRAAWSLATQGYEPDVIVAHPGWGESLFLKDVWPDTQLLMYCEFYYSTVGADVGFDPEFSQADPGQRARLRMKNVNSLLHFEMADAGVSPTRWQRSTYPEPFRSKIEVIHDGIDTARIRPDTNVALQLGSLRLTRQDEVITFVNRNLEPYRGYHTFMRALPEILAKRPNAHVLIVGGDGVSYGAAAPAGQSWKQIFLDEVKERLDMNRVHFLGNIEYKHFIPLLQLSTVHVYLTYPFVLSWSLLEAMACGCAIVASDTAPLQEAIRHDETGRLFDFFSPAALAKEVLDLLAHPETRQRLGARARELAIAQYDLKSVCLPQMLALIERVAIQKRAG